MNIPKVFHQIWINHDNPQLPERFSRYRDTWLTHHPGWEYHLWNLENLDFEPSCKALLTQCQHPAQMADLLRFEILYRYGGVYIDTDFVCLKSIEVLLNGCTGFIVSEDGKHLSTGILGSSAGAQWVKRIIDCFPESLGQYSVNIETGPVFITRVILEKGLEPGIAIFPSKLFYPFNYHTVDKASVDFTESYAIHHYADSWKKPLDIWARFSMNIRSLKNFVKSR